MKLNIKINQSIISALGKKLYSSDFGMVVLRELLQNSLDAGATKIDITQDMYTLTVTDNGTGINRIEGLLDTIGESDKSSNDDIVGGFGIAKLAIFGCKQWAITSQCGTFSTGYNLNESDRIEHGTIVKVTFDESDIQMWAFDYQIKDYVQLVNRSVTFTYNGATLKPYEVDLKQLGGLTVLTSQTHQNGHIIVRVNGLPTFQRYMSNLKDTIILDYAVTLKPYDSDYPLSSNRDSFRVNTKESTDYQAKIAQIQISLETEKKLAEQIHKQMNSVVWRGEKFIAAGKITLEDFESASMTISSYRRYIRQIAELEHDSHIDSAQFGLTDSEDNELGAYNPANNIFLISKNVTHKGCILSIACHEYVHSLGFANHDQSFANMLTQVTSVVMVAMYDGKFRR